MIRKPQMESMIYISIGIGYVLLGVLHNQGSHEAGTPATPSEAHAPSVSRTAEDTETT